MIVDNSCPKCGGDALKTGSANDDPVLYTCYGCNSLLLLEKHTRIERSVIGWGLIITLATLYLLSLVYSVFSVIYIVSFFLFSFGVLLYEIWERTVHTVKLKCVVKI